MIKTVTAERTIEAPADLIYQRLVAVDRHPEWDETAQKVELIAPGDASGLGSEWKVYEHFGIFHSASGDDRAKQGTALSKRTIEELVPNERVAWSTHMLPNLGIGATVTWTLVPEGRSTRASVEVAISVPTVVEKVGRVMFRALDDRYEGRLATLIDRLKLESEAEFAKQVVAV